MNATNQLHILRHIELMSAAIRNGFKHVTISYGGRHIKTTIYYYSLKVSELPDNIINEYAKEGDTIRYYDLSDEYQEVYSKTLVTQLEK